MKKVYGVKKRSLEQFYAVDTEKQDQLSVSLLNRNRDAEQILNDYERGLVAELTASEMQVSGVRTAKLLSVEKHEKISEQAALMLSEARVETEILNLKTNEDLLRDIQRSGNKLSYLAVFNWLVQKQRRETEWQAGLGFPLYLADFCESQNIFQLSVQEGKHCVLFIGNLSACYDPNIAKESSLSAAEYVEGSLAGVKALQQQILVDIPIESPRNGFSIANRITTFIPNVDRKECRAVSMNIDTDVRIGNGLCHLMCMAMIVGYKDFLEQNNTRLVEKSERIRYLNDFANELTLENLETCFSFSSLCAMLNIKLSLRDLPKGVYVN